MISTEKWAELATEWETIGPVYQTPRRSKDRLKHFCLTCLPYLAGKRVLEIGCNAGVLGYCVAEVSESYTGVEPGNKIIKKGKKPKTDYYRQAVITKSHIESNNATYLNQTIGEYCKDVGDVNAFVACFALYHFTDKELGLLDENVFSKCDTVIIQNRTQDRPTRHNSHKFWKDKNVVKYFTRLGFGKIELIPATGQDGKQAFTEIICTR